MKPTNKNSETKGTQTVSAKAKAPNTILVKTKIPLNIGDKLKAENGIIEVEYDVHVIARKQIQEAMKLKIPREERETSLGATVIDTGKHLVAGNNALCTTRNLTVDLVAMAGYPCTSIVIYRKVFEDKKDPYYTLEAAFNKESLKVERTIENTPGANLQWSAFTKVVDKTFQHIHIWSNPNGIDTINLVNGQNEYAKTNIRITTKTEGDKSFITYSMLPERPIGRNMYEKTVAERKPKNNHHNHRKFVKK